MTPGYDDPDPLKFERLPPQPHHATVIRVRKTSALLSISLFRNEADTPDPRFSVRP